MAPQNRAKMGKLLAINPSNTKGKILLKFCLLLCKRITCVSFIAYKYSYFLISQCQNNV